MNAPLIIPFRGKTPKIAPDAFIAPGAVLIGDIEIGPQSTVWFGCVLRGDLNAIRVGARTNIQDGTIIHVDSGHTHKDSATHSAGHPAFIGDDVTIGHMVLLHGCTLESGAFVGMRSVVMDGVVVEGGAVVAAGALVSPFKRVLRGQLWAGMPAKLMRELKPSDAAEFNSAADHYVEMGQAYRAQLGL